MDQSNAGTDTGGRATDQRIVGKHRVPAGGGGPAKKRQALPASKKYLHNSFVEDTRKTIKERKK